MGEHCVKTRNAFVKAEFPTGIHVVIARGAPLRKILGASEDESCNDKGCRCLAKYVVYDIARI